MSRDTSSAPRIFYGWFVVPAAFAVTFVGFGSAYTFSAFVESLQRDFGASRGSVSLVFSLAGFLYFGARHHQRSPRGSFWFPPPRRRRHDLTGLGLAAASAARNLPEVYAAYGLGVGLGVGCAYVPAIGAVQRWFVRRRGFASGLAVERHRCRHAGDAAAGLTPIDAWAGAAPTWRLASGRRRGRGPGAPDRKQPARPRSRSRR